VICYVVVWALQLLIIQNGMETVRRFQDWAGRRSGRDAGAGVGLCVKAGRLLVRPRHPQDVLSRRPRTPASPASPARSGR
jgi:NCS1 family nucleobase:cation symporter-1